MINFHHRGDSVEIYCSSVKICQHNFLREYFGFLRCFEIRKTFARESSSMKILDLLGEKFHFTDWLRQGLMRNIRVPTAPFFALTSLSLKLFLYMIFSINVTTFLSPLSVCLISLVIFKRVFLSTSKLTSQPRGAK